MQTQDKAFLYNPAMLSREELISSFTARHELLQRLLDVIRQQKADSAGLQHLLLIGPRGSGKTTLLLRLRYAVEDDPELAARWTPIGFAEEEYGVGDLADFWLKVLENPENNTSGSRGKDIAHRLRRETRDAERLEALALVELERRVTRSGRRLLLLVDNVNLILDQIREDRQIHRLRAALMEKPWLLMVAAAPSTFESIELSNAPFYEFFQTHTLRGLSLDDMRAVLSQWAEREGNRHLLDKLREGAPLLRSLHQLTGGNPRMIAVIYQLLRDAPLTDVYAVLRRLVDEVTPYYKHRTEELPIQARRIVDGLARRWDPTPARELGLDLRIPTSVVSAQLNKLAGDGWVEKFKQARPTTYQLAERFYNIYYLMRHGRNEMERLRALLRFMKYLYDDQDLGLLLRRIEARMGRGGEGGPHNDENLLELARLSMIAEAAESSQLKRYTFDRAFYWARRICTDKDSLASYLDLDGARAVLGEERVETELNLPEMQRRYEEDPNPETAAAYADALLGLGELNRVVPVLEWAIANDGGNLSWLRALALTFLNLARSEEALKAAERACEAFPEESEPWNIRAIAAQQLGQMESAEGWFRKAIELKPEDPTLRLNLANLFLSTNDVARAETTLAELLKRDAGNSAAHFLLAQTCIVRREFQAAEEHLRLFSAKGTEKRQGFAGVFLALCLREQGRETAASKTLGRALRQLRDPTELGQLAGFLSQVGQFVEAEAVARRRLEVDNQKHPAPHFKLAVVLYRAGKTEEAERSFTRALETAKSRELAHELGQWCLVSGLVRQATRAFSQVVELDERFGLAWSNLSVAQLLAGETNEALESARNAVRWAPEDTNAWTNLLACEQATRRFSEMLDTIAKARGHGHDTPDFAAKELEALVALSRFDEAKAAGHAATNKWGTVPPLLVPLARLHRLTGHVDKALDILSAHTPSVAAPEYANYWYEFLLAAKQSERREETHAALLALTQAPKLSNEILQDMFTTAAAIQDGPALEAFFVALSHNVATVRLLPIAQAFEATTGEADRDERLRGLFEKACARSKAREDILRVLTQMETFLRCLTDLDMEGAESSAGALEAESKIQAADAWTTLGDQRAAMGQTEAAERAWRHALELVPWLEYGYRLMTHYHLSGRWGELEVLARELGERYPGDRPTQLYLAEALEALGKTDEGRELWDRLLEDAADAFPIHLRRLRLFARLGRKTELDAELEEIIPLAKEHPSKAEELLGLMWDHGYQERAIELSEALVGQHPKSGDLWAIRADLLLLPEAHALLGTDDALEAAETAARQAHAVLPDDPDILAILGEACARRGKWREALGHLETLLDTLSSLESGQEASAPAGGDDEVLEDAMLDLAVSLAAAGASAELAKLLDEKGFAGRWEPLRVALAVDSGEQPDRLRTVAQEIADVARELLERVQEERRSEDAAPREGGV